MFCKPFSVFLLIFAFVAIGFGQKAEPVLATATGLTFTVNDLSAEGRQLYEQRSQLIARQRKELFNDWVYDLLIETEAKARGTTPDKVQADEVAKIAAPTEGQIKAVFDANRQTIGDRTIDQVRTQIVDYLKRESEDKQLGSLAETLKVKHKFVPGKDINAADLKPSDVIASIGSRTLTANEYESQFKIKLHNLRAGIYEQIKSDFESAVLSKLIDVEAKKRNVDASAVIAAEITNKLKDYSDYERMYLEDMLQSRLFTEYAVKLDLEPPQPLVLNVSVDDDPSLGDPSAKVTVVAFVDFQCSACAAFTPLLKRVVSEFGPSVRLVVRDYPLTSIHKEAMKAALAGYAARQQGKFCESVDLMYRNQDALDDDSLIKYAQQAGLNAEQFDRDLHSAAAAAGVKKDIADGTSYGVSGTPTVFVNGVQLQRLTTLATREAIKNALKK